MSDTELEMPLNLNSIRALLREAVLEGLREQNEIFQERVDEINLLKEELSQIVKESFIMGADAQKSNETKIAHLLTQFEEAVNRNSEKMNETSQKAEERAEKEGAYSEIAQKNLDRAGKWSIWILSFSVIVFAATIFYFNQVRMDAAAKLNEDRATLTQINEKLEAQKSVHKTEPIRKSKQ